MVIEYASMSDTGRVRENNEDACGGFVPGEGDERAGRGALFVVADGMGGHRGGEIASGLAVRTVSERFFASQADPGAALAGAFTDANAAIFGEASADATLLGMGTTCTALALRDGGAWLAHVGDSRAYLVRGGDIEQITQDHSLVGEMVRSGIITDEDARTHPKRHVITRSLGVQELIDADTMDAPLPVRVGDVFVLCSDGLTSYVEAHEIQQAVGSGNAQSACEALVALANNRGGRDNITVMVVSISAV